MPGGETEQEMRERVRNLISPADLQGSVTYLHIVEFLDASQSVSGWVIDSFRLEIAIASTKLASLF